MYKGVGLRSRHHNAKIRQSFLRKSEDIAFRSPTLQRFSQDETIRCVIVNYKNTPIVEVLKARSVVK
jgi:hypothetical protein